jgi:tartrate-resistant acid phosphatase type 5
MKNFTIWKQTAVRWGLPAGTLIVLLFLSAASCLQGGIQASECRPPFTLPAREPGTAYLEFLAAGDTGSGNGNQRTVADAMKAYARLQPVDLVLLLGDNFYEDGVSSSSDPQWETKFEQMYDASVLSMPFYAVLGNHDYRLQPLAQVDYSGPATRWTMPSRYYSFSRSLSDGTGVDFFAIDTNTIAGEPAQLAWLEAALEASGADWKIVFGHHVLFSNGSHGDDAGLIALLSPLFSEKNVDLYMAGHDHDLQILKPRDGVRYLVDGAGSRLRDTRCLDNTEYAVSRLGFMAVRVSKEELAVLVVLEEAVVDYALVISKH